jgi:glucokinase
MENNKNSRMWEKYNLTTISGKTAFDYCDCDEAAKGVVENYIKYLGCGLTNLANIFRPQVIMLGGGVAAQGERLTAPLQKILDKEIMGGNDRARVQVVCATLGNKAGALGAAALCM